MENILLTAYCKKLNANFKVAINKIWNHISDTVGRGEIQIMGKNIICELKQKSENKELYVVFERKDLPPRFVSDLAVPKAMKQIGFVVEFPELAWEEINKIDNDRKEAEAARVAGLKDKAKVYRPTGWAYDFGCDTSDSNYFIFSENTPEELKPYIETPGLTLVSKHIKSSDIQSFRGKFGTIGKLESRLFSYGGAIFSMESFIEINKIAQEREDKIIARQKAQEEAKEAEENRVKALAQGRTVISVHCEFESHNQDLPNRLLNSPAPRTGAFLVGCQVERNIWEKMKAQGAKYYSREFLEDIDEFNAQPGWRYSLGAVSELIKAGFAVKIGKEVFIKVEDLFGFYGIEIKSEQIIDKTKQVNISEKELENRIKYELVAHGFTKDRISKIIDAFFVIYFDCKKEKSLDINHLIICASEFNDSAKSILLSCLGSNYIKSENLPNSEKEDTKIFTITGNSYPVKDNLKKLGCTWNPALKVWQAKGVKMAREAQEIVYYHQTGDRGLAEEMAEEALGI